MTRPCYFGQILDCCSPAAAFLLHSLLWALPISFIYATALLFIIQQQAARTIDEVKELIETGEVNEIE